ncbi:MAG TPA: hypothetical protein PKL31_08115 [Fulvivirga sp.]|nr:hypothetical protein [Fulvivirga sp.]
MKSDNIAHLKNLLVLAFSDGVLEDSEINNLRNAAAELGIEKALLDDWIENVDQLVLLIPEDDEEREKQLINMISMSTADGFFSQDEYDLCLRISEKLGYNGLSETLNRCMDQSNLKNLIALASADGHVDASELKIIKEAAKTAGVSDKKLEEWLKIGADFIHVIPEREDDREMQLIQMLTLAIADGEFTEDEYNLCKVVAERLGFSQQELDMIIKLSFSKEPHLSKATNF